MPLMIVRNDITKMNVDAIVSCTDSAFLSDGGVSACINKAAGSELSEACKKLGECKPGEAKITSAFNLPAKYVIHTVGPVWNGGNENEFELLRSCYLSSLGLAVEYNLESIAFPLISSGAYGFFKEESLRIATEAIEYFLNKSDITVYLVVFDNYSFQISSKLFHDVKQYVDDNYVSSAFNSFREHERRAFSSAKMCAPASESYVDDAVDFMTSCDVTLELKKKLEELDESFSQMLLRLIDEKGLTDAQCYKKANIDRKLFSKIRSDVYYRPSKQTALAFAVALELDLKQTEEMLKKAGYALSKSNKFDVIVEYFIVKRNYNIFEINEVLFTFDQVLLGCR